MQMLRGEETEKQKRKGETHTIVPAADSPFRGVSHWSTTSCMGNSLFGLLMRTLDECHMSQSLGGQKHFVVTHQPYCGSVEHQPPFLARDACKKRVRDTQFET